MYTYCLEKTLLSRGRKDYKMLYRLLDKTLTSYMICFFFIVHYLLDKTTLFYTLLWQTLNQNFGIVGLWSNNMHYKKKNYLDTNF